MDISKPKDVEEKSIEEEKECVYLLVDRKRIDKIVLDKHEEYSRTDLSRMGQRMVAHAHIEAAKALLSVTDKEKAKEAFYKATYAGNYDRMRPYSESLGNPKDLQSYVELLRSTPAPFIPPLEVVEKSNTKIVYGLQICPYADAFRELAENLPGINQDVLEVALCRCDAIDVATATAWNPDMKFKRTHFMLADLIGGPPSKGCYFEAEVTE